MQRHALKLLEDLRKIKKSINEPNPISEHSEADPKPDPEPIAELAPAPLPLAEDPVVLRYRYAALREKLRHIPMTPELHALVAILPDPDDLT